VCFDDPAYRAEGGDQDVVIGRAEGQSDGVRYVRRRRERLGRGNRYVFGEKRCRDLVGAYLVGQGEPSSDCSTGFRLARI
jgi:hypothetical protein